MAAPRLRRAMDQINATRLSFPLHLVIVIVASAVSATGGVYFVTSDLRNAVNIMQAQRAEQVETAKVQRTLDEERMSRAADKQQAANESLRVTVDTIQRELRLLQIDVKNAQLAMERK